MKVGRPRSIDEEKFHKFLWDKSDRFGRLKINQTSLAVEYGVNRRTVSRLMDRMKEEDILKFVKHGYKQIGHYVVKEPE